MKRKRSLLHDVGFGTNSNTPSLSLAPSVPPVSVYSSSSSSSLSLSSSTTVPPTRNHPPLTITSRSSSPLLPSFTSPSNNTLTAFSSSTTGTPTTATPANSNVDDDVLFWQNIDNELPNDTELVLQLFRKQFSTIVTSKVRRRTSDLLNENIPRFEVLCGIPIIPLTVIYGSIFSSLSKQYRTQIDKDIALLQGTYTIRLLKLVTDDSKEFAVGYTNDIKNYVIAKQEYYRKHRSTAIENTNSLSSSSSSSSSSTTDSPVVPELSNDKDIITALDVYCYLSNMYPVAILLSHDEITQGYHQWINEGKPSTELRSPTKKKKNTMNDPTLSLPTEKKTTSTITTTTELSSAVGTKVGPAVMNEVSLPSSSLSTTVSSSSSSSSLSSAPSLSSILRILLSMGMLVRRNDTHVSTLLASQSFAPGASVAYYFGIPESGRMITYLRNGRIELVQRIKRTHYKEILRHDVLKMNLTRSALPMEFHIRDAIGLGLLTELSTAHGKFIALPKISSSV